MTDSNGEPDDNGSKYQTGAVSRRRALKSGLATAGAFVVGVGATGTVASESGRFNDAPGRGGEAVVPEADFYPNENFRIIERAGNPPQLIEGVRFECNEGDGESIFLVGWNFEYDCENEDECENEDGTKTLYTRSNNIDTERIFSWSGDGHKQCEGSGQKVTVENGEPIPSGDTGDYVQTPYSATGRQ